MDILLLDVINYVDETKWSWHLSDLGGATIARSRVSIDRASSEYEGFVDLYNYLHWNAAPDRVRSDIDALVARVGRWVGETVLGGIGPAIASRAVNSPVVALVRIPDDARKLFTLPFELAYVADRPLALHNVSLVYQSSEETASRPVERSFERAPLRILGIFSLPESEHALGLRDERLQLEAIANRLNRVDGKAVDLRVVQYGVTRERLRQILAEPDGWDVVHISGHGLPGGLILETADGKHDLIGTRRLADLLALATPRLSLVSLASCESAAGADAASLAQIGLTRSPLTPATMGGIDQVLHDAGGVQLRSGAERIAADHGSSGALPNQPPAASTESHTPLPTLASQVARQLDCAVLAMRYRTSDEFSAALNARLYEHLLGGQHPLPRALQMAIADLAPKSTAFSVVTPALFGPRAVTLKLMPIGTGPSVHGTPVRVKAAGDLPPQPDVFVGRTGAMTRCSAALAPRSEWRGVILHGMPGIGKTAVCLELVHTHRDNFASIWWYSAIEDSGSEGALARFAVYLDSRLAELGLRQSLDNSQLFEESLANLRSALEHERILLVIDGADALLGSEPGFHDLRWESVFESLLSHSGPARLIITCRRRPQRVGERVVVEAVPLLSPVEGLLACLRNKSTRALLSVTTGEYSYDGTDLLSRALIATGGHPGLIVMIGHLSVDPQRMGRHLDRATEASARERFPLIRFLSEANVPGADERLGEIAAWTEVVRGNLSGEAAMLFDVLCAVEERDCGDFAGKIAWGRIADRFIDGPRRPDFETLLHTLESEGLVEVVPADEGRFRVFRIHPVVAEAGRLAAAQTLRAAVDEELSMILHSGYMHILKSEQSRFGTMLREFGIRAVPYLVRAERLGDASDVLMALVARDPSPEMVEEAVATLRHIAERAVGTSYELLQRAYILRVQAFANPAAAEAQLRDLLVDAESANDSGLVLALLNDLTRGALDASRPSDALALANRAFDLAQSAGYGRWAELGVEVKRLQIQILTGSAERVLERVGEIDAEMDGMPALAPEEDNPHSWDRRENWNTREAILHTGMLAAMELQQWDRSLEYASKIRASLEAREAPQFFVASTEFVVYRALAGLGRVAEAREMLRRSRDVFIAHGDIALAGKAIGALADIERRLGHRELALRLQYDALRLHYADADLLAVYTGHINLAYAMRTDGTDVETSLAHQIAATMIAREAELGGYGSALRDLANQMTRTPDSLLLPASFAVLCMRADASAGTDLAALWARFWPARDGDDALAQVLNGARNGPSAGPGADEHIRSWEPVAAAFRALRQDDARAAIWLARSLQERSSTWPGLTATLLHLVGDDATDVATDCMDPVSAAIVRRVRSVASGELVADPRNDLTWRISDYLNSVDPANMTPGGRAAVMGDDASERLAKIVALLTTNAVDAEWRATMLLEVGSRLANWGKHAQALTALEPAVRQLMHLTSGNPSTFETHLATAFQRMGEVLAGLRRWDEAERAEFDALAIRRRRAAAESALNGDLAASLNDLGGLLCERGSLNHGIELLEEAVDLYRRLAAEQRQAYGPLLGLALRNLSLALSRTGRTSEALEGTKEAVEIWRDAAATNPAYYENLASAQGDLSEWLLDLGDSDQATSFARAAVDARRQIADTNSAAESTLASALLVLGSRLQLAERHAEALDAVQEAVSIYRQLARSETAYELGLALALSVLGTYMSSGEGDGDSEVPAREAVTILARLCSRSPTHELHLAEALNNLAVLLSHRDQPTEVIASLRSASDIYARHLEAGDETVLRPLATTINNLFVTLESQQDWAGVVAIADRTITLHRTLVGHDPVGFEPMLAHALSGFAAAAYKLDDASNEAIEAAKEARAIYDRLGNDSSKIYSRRSMYAASLLKGLLLKRDRLFLDAELEAMKGLASYLDERSRDTADQDRLDFDARPSLSTLFHDVEPSDVVRQAMRNAATTAQAAHTPLDTRMALLAVMRIDMRGDWARFALHARSADAVALAVVRDPDETAGGQWEGSDLTVTLVRSLRVAARIASLYALEPIPPGVFVLGLVASPFTGASRALGVGHDVEYAQLLSLIQESLIGVELTDLNLDDL